MTNKGFPSITTDLGKARAVVLMPLFFSETKVSSRRLKYSRSITLQECALNLERMIKQIKIYYVLNTRVPTELIPAMCDVFHVLCSGYLQPPIIKESITANI